MERYKNLNGNSGVSNFALGDEWIEVEFLRKGIYRYTYKSAGRAQIEKMKQLARKGQGLSTYISQHTHNMYEKILPSFTST